MSLDVDVLSRNAVVRIGKLAPRLIEFFTANGFILRSWQDRRHLGQPRLLVGRSRAVRQARDNELRQTWRFYPMLRRLMLPRIDAMTLAENAFTWPLDLSATSRLIDVAVAEALPIMVFAGSRGCVQIHAGPIRNIQIAGPWLNIMDETFHLHLRLDDITKLWAVRKPTDAGQVTSVEAYGANGSLIVQFFGIQKKGLDAPRWVEIVDALPRQQAKVA